MKKMKKLAGLVLALVMVFAMTTTAFAAGNGKITIKRAAIGQTYRIYKVFDLESYSTGTAYSYTVDSAWKAFVTEGAGKDYIDVTTVSGTDYITWKDGKNTDVDYATFAKAALAYAQTNGIAAVKTAKATANVLEFTELSLGYYLVDNDLGTLCLLDTTDPDAEVTEKNSGPQLFKYVEENGEWKEKNDANIGDTVNFKIDIIAQEGAEGFLLTDTLSEGLTLNQDSIVVKKADQTLVVDTDYSISKGTQQFTIAFVQTFLDGLKDNDTLTVEYSAVLNELALISTANINSARLNYGENSQFRLAPDKTTETYTWNFNVFKYTGADTALAGAKFKVHKATAEGDVVNFVQNGTAYKVCTLTGCAHTHVTEIETTATGKFDVNGLDSGTYYLEETVAPAGYNKLSTAIKVVIDADGNVEKDDVAATDKVIKVENRTGSLLPVTGGIGTTIIYVIGAILVIGAAVLLITKKRMSAE